MPWLSHTSKGERGGFLPEILLPIARFTGHALASAVGFVILLCVTLIPIVALKLFQWLGVTELAAIFNWHWLEIGILYLDIALYGFMILMWAAVFIVEEIRAVKRTLGW
ncbi:MAG TPA: hypothetical protein VEK73_19230 [Xanthobacteraceae bacterium]|nr:hypothetical protein [Xanthobacteraceae bacterium]